MPLPGPYTLPQDSLLPGLVPGYNPVKQTRDGNALRLYIPASSNNDGWQVEVDAEPGPYSSMVHVWTDQEGSAGETIRLRLAALDSEESELDDAEETIVMTDAPQALAVSLEAPADTMKVVSWVGSADGAHDEAWVLVDAERIAPQAGPVPYRDGTYPFWKWDGTPGESASEQIGPSGDSGSRSMMMGVG